MTPEGSVTVIIPAYNAAATLAKAILSAMAEPSVSEIVVVDDCSNDNTLEVAKRYDNGSGRLKILHQDQNKGPSAARNLAIRESKALWISILDSDDYFLSGRIAGLLKYAGEGADMIADDLWQIKAGEPDNKRVSLLGEDRKLPRDINLEEFVLSNISSNNKERGELGFIKPLIRRRFLMEHNIQYREDMRLGEDYELYVRVLATGGKLLLVPAQGYVSVLRPDSLSGRHSVSDLKMLRDSNLSIHQDFHLNNSEKTALRRHYLDTDCRLQWRLLILAVKNRSVISALKTFIRPWPVPKYLTEKLIEQFIIRVCKNTKSA